MDHHQHGDVPSVAELEEGQQLASLKRLVWSEIKTAVSFPWTLHTIALGQMTPEVETCCLVVSLCVHCRCCSALAMPLNRYMVPFQPLRELSAALSQALQDTLANQLSFAPRESHKSSDTERAKEAAQVN